MPSQDKGQTADSDMLTIAEFCSLNRISPRLYYSMRDRGDGPAVIMIGRHVRISRAAAEEWRERWTRQ
jgi:hypothetical protein